MLICKSMIIFLFHNRFIIKLKGSDISENVKRGHLKMISFVKTVKLIKCFLESRQGLLLLFNL